MLISGASKERQLDADETIERFHAILDEAGFRRNYSRVGCHAETVFCEIVGPRGHTAIGVGKGFGKQSMASAVAEAVEHYFYETETPDFLTLEVQRASAPRWFFDGSPNFSEIIQQQTVTFDHIRFEKYNQPCSCLYPAFLGNPSYVPSTASETRSLERFSLHRYSCNSGVAAGLAAEDARLHGILELIERDSLSVLLLETIIREAPKPVRLIRTESLPADFRDCVADIEKEVGATFAFFDITSDLRIPTVLASLTVHQSSARYFGSGASLSCSYALERAFTEALQCLHAQRELGFCEPVPFFRGCTADLPKYALCLMDKGYFEYRGGYTEVRFGDLDSAYRKLWSDSGDVAKQYKDIAEYLERQFNIDTYQRNIYSNDTQGIFVSQVLAPVLERFHLVSNGLFVLPAARGMRFLEMA